MSNSYVLVPSGEKIDNELLSVGGIAVMRQRKVISDPSGENGHARVLNQMPAAGDYALIVRTNNRGATSVITVVDDSTTSQLLKAANTQRISLTIVNTSSAALMVALSSTAASATNFTYWLEQYQSVRVDDWLGTVYGIWATDPGDGIALVTEVTP